jgi:hypothetical protein
MGPRASRWRDVRHGGCHRLTTRLTLADLRRWEDHGASWRALEIEDGAVTVQLCTCFGEPVELARGRDPELVSYVRQRQSSEA